MGKFTIIAALLCTFSWISVSVAEFVTVEVQPAQEVTLMCNNYTRLASNIFWYRITSEPIISCISSMSSSIGKVFLFGGFQNDKFDMTSNVTNLFLKIRSVDVSDSGLYFCGFTVKHLYLQCKIYINLWDSEFDSDIDRMSQRKSDVNTNLMGGILCGLTVLLLMAIIGLAVTVRNRHKVNFARNGRRRRELEPNVIQID
uniref:Ig-like domain-containing protein n=1 Tax=Stegastes partitus TaxID=144197 RepID=A0A3B5ARA8_9TELE